MIEQVMRFCKNHFPRSKERKKFTFVSDGITGTFTETYVIGQYIWVRESFVNDGVYQIIEKTSSKLTLNATLTSEETNGYSTVLGLHVPNDFLSLVCDIESWVTNNGGREGIVSEKIDDYSVNYGKNATGQMANTWQIAFGDRLVPYKQVYETVEMPLKNGVYGYGNYGLLR
jgi:hypothetical protein